MRTSLHCGILLLVASSLFGDSLSFDAAVSRYLEHNIDLRIARQEASKSQTELITAKEHPNPIFSASNEYMKLNRNSTDTSAGSKVYTSVALNHTYETADKRERRIDLAHHSIVFSGLLYDEIVRKNLGTLVDAYYAVLNDQNELTNGEENAKDYAKLVAIAKAKFDGGFLSQVDYQKILLQKIDYLKDVENSALSLTIDRENLGFMLAVSSSEMIVTAPSSSINVVEPLEKYLEKIDERADCKAAKENLSVTEAALKLEKANAVPDVNIGANFCGYGPDYQPMVGAFVSVPIAIFDRNEGVIEKARIEALQATNLSDRTLRAAKVEIIQSYKTVESYIRIYNEMVNGFNSAKELKEKEEKIFALKGVSVLELLDAQKSYREYQKKMNRALVDLHSAQARLKLNSKSSLGEFKGN